MDSTVTLCITSYNRFQLLQQAINSFVLLNKYPLEEIIVIEDSAKSEMRQKILDNFGTTVRLIYNDVTLGQPKSIDKMYSEVKSKYIFHSEDDYCYVGNSNFIKDSIDILEENPDIHQVWLRHKDNYTITHGSGTINTFLDPHILSTSTNVKYQKIIYPHGGGWCGFSWNAGLRRKQDYQTMFPNGFGKHIKHGEVSSMAEALCNNHAAQCGYRAAFLLNGACNDVGRESSTYK